MGESPTEDQVERSSSVNSADAETSLQEPSFDIKKTEFLIDLPETCMSDLMQAELYVLQIHI